MHSCPEQVICRVFDATGVNPHWETDHTHSRIITSARLSAQPASRTSHGALQRKVRPLQKKKGGNGGKLHSKQKYFATIYRTSQLRKASRYNRTPRIARPCQPRALPALLNRRSRLLDLAINNALCAQRVPSTHLRLRHARSSSASASSSPFHPALHPPSCASCP